MNKNIIDFYLAASNLKSTVRTGWQEVGIPSDKVESVADHICGCLILTVGLLSEKEYSNLDLNKIMEMLLVKELCKSVTNEQSITSKEDKKAANEAAVKSILAPLKRKDELFALYEEANANETHEAQFVQKVAKLESDLQAKKYELQGDFKLEAAKADVANYPSDLANEILPQVKKASDGWLLFDRRYYGDDEVFVSLSKDIQDL